MFTLYVIKVPIYIFLYPLSIKIIVAVVIFNIFVFNFYATVKDDLHTVIKVLEYSELTIYLLLPVAFVLSYVFMLLISVFSFQLEELPLAFFVRQV